GSPLVLGLQIDEIFRVAESSRVGSVVGRSGLRDDLGDLGKRSEDIAGLLCEACSFRLAYAVRHRATRPDGALVQVGQKLRADDAAKRQEKSDRQRSQANADGEPSVLD